jgi:hypothetical protein
MRERAKQSGSMSVAAAISALAFVLVANPRDRGYRLPRLGAKSL